MLTSPSTPLSLPICHLVGSSFDAADQLVDRYRLCVWAGITFLSAGRPTESKIGCHEKPVMMTLVLIVPFIIAFRRLTLK